MLHRSTLTDYLTALSPIIQPTLKKALTSSILLLVLAMLEGCDFSLAEDVQVYQSDFGSGDVTNIENARPAEFMGSPVLGFYNAEEVTLSLFGIPAHDALQITVEIYIHDSWDGNVQDVGGPDIWYLGVDGENVLRTTFSNSPCTSSYCLYQSFPGQYPTFNTPKSGAEPTNLPGRCQYQNVAGWSSLYRISRVVPHTGTNALITLGDELKQTNARSQVCDESWSIKSIRVSTVVRR